MTKFDIFHVKIVTYNKKFLLRKVRKYNLDNNNSTEGILKTLFYFLWKDFRRNRKN